MMSEGSHILLPSIAGSCGKLPSFQGIKGRLFDKMYYKLFESVI